MPRQKPNASKSGAVFVVSSWKDKAEKRSNEQITTGNESLPQDVSYTVVSEDIFAKSESRQPVSVPQRQSNLGEQQLASDQDQRAGDWNTIDRSKPTQPVPNEIDSNIDGHVAEDAPLNVLGTLEEDDFSLAFPTDTNVMHGTAYLALLPNGSITGHLVYQYFTLGEWKKTTCGVTAKEVLSYRECTRDAEWRVLRCTIINFSTRKEVTFLMQRTGEDAMQLQAPFEWQGMEAEEAHALSHGCEQNAHLTFNCEQLLSDASADAILQKLQPGLVGTDCALNIGNMRISMPKGLL